MFCFECLLRMNELKANSCEDRMTQANRNYSQKLVRLRTVTSGFAPTKQVDSPTKQADNPTKQAESSTKQADSSTKQDESVDPEGRKSKMVEHKDVKGSKR